MFHQDQITTQKPDSGCYAGHARTQNKDTEKKGTNATTIKATFYWTHEETAPHCLKITQNVAFEFLNFGIFHQLLSY